MLFYHFSFIFVQSFADALKTPLIFSHFRVDVSDIHAIWRECGCSAQLKKKETHIINNKIL